VPFTGAEGTELTGEGILKVCFFFFFLSLWQSN